MKIGLIIVGIGLLFGLTAIGTFVTTGKMKAFKIIYPYITVFGGVLLLGFSTLSILSPDKNIQTNIDYFNGLKKELFDQVDEGEKSTDLIAEDVVSYGHNLVEAINTGDFTIVSDALYPDSPLYESQKKLVDRLYHGRITEEIIRYEVEAVRIHSDDWAEVDTYEAIDVYHPDVLKNTEYHWRYQLKWNEQVEQYLLYSIEIIAQ